MATPRAFLDFFAKDFQLLLADCTIPGMDNPSWDRRAAYLLFTNTDTSLLLGALPDEEPDIDPDDLI